MSRRVDLSKNQLARLPDELAQFEHLEMLCCARNQLVALPPSLGCSLTSLDLSRNALTQLPEELFGRLASLRRLDLSRNQLAAVPTSIGELPTLVELDLAHNLLRAVPNISLLAALTVLDLSANRLSALPPGTEQLTENLAVLELADNEITVLPPNLHRLEALETLTLDGNHTLVAPPPRVVERGVMHTFDWLLQNVAAGSTASRLPADTENINLSWVRDTPSPTHTSHTPRPPSRGILSRTPLSTLDERDAGSVEPPRQQSRLVPTNASTARKTAALVVDLSFFDEGVRTIIHGIPQSCTAMQLVSSVLLQHPSALGDVAPADIEVAVAMSSPMRIPGIKVSPLLFRLGQGVIVTDLNLKDAQIVLRQRTDAAMPAITVTQQRLGSSIFGRPRRILQAAPPPVVEEPVAPPGKHAKRNAYRKAMKKARRATRLGNAPVPTVTARPQLML